MPQKILVLTEKDADVLRKFLADARRRSVNAVGRGKDGTLDHEEILAPELYIAKVPEQGIEALVGSGEDEPGQEGDIPGVADCDIYRILEENGTPKLRAVLFDKHVYNLATTPINSIPWIVTARDKFGSWLTIGPGDFIPGTGTESECGHLILDCPDDSPGTGSEVSIGTGTEVGHTSPCNDGEIVPDNFFLGCTYDGNYLVVLMEYGAGYGYGGGDGWRYTGGRTPMPGVAGLEIAEVNWFCSGGEWYIGIAAYLDDVLVSFATPFGIHSVLALTHVPFHWTAETADFNVGSYNPSETFVMYLEATA